MTDFLTDPCEAAAGCASWEAEGTEAGDLDRAGLDGDRVPALARHFHITDLQHWIDLCA